MGKLWLVASLSVMTFAQAASVSISGGTRITLSPICQTGKGPAVEARVENVGLEPINSLEAVMPWRNWGQITFEPEDTDFEVVAWVDHSHHTERLVIAPGESVSGVMTLWDKIEPRDVSGRRTLRWKYGLQHSGVLQLDLDKCPILWKPVQ